MKKLLKILGITAMVLIGLFFVARLTGILLLFKIPTGANEPNIKIGSYAWGSKLSTPKRFDFVLYRVFDAEVNDTAVHMHRLCGIPGDVVEMRDGVLLINGKDVDKDLALKHFYVMTSKQLASFSNDEDDILSTSYTITDDSCLTILEDKLARQVDFKPRRLIQPKNKPDESMQNIFHQPWNTDNFGPFRLLPDQYFVLGDNRHNSFDSRYVGLIPKRNIVGTVIGK